MKIVHTFLSALFFITDISLSALSPSYFMQCDLIAPTETLPSSYTSYHEAYIQLEKETPLSSLSEITSIKDLIIKFLHDELKIEARAEQLICLNDSAAHGLSGNAVYKLVEQNQSPLLIKVFKEASGCFSEEFFSLKTYSALNLTQLHFPHVKGIGFYSLDNRPHFLLAMDFVQGISLHNLYISLFHQYPESEQRIKQLENLVQIYAQLGTGLAKFHQVQNSKPLFLHPLLQNTFNLIGERFFETFQPLDQVDVSKAYALFKKDFSAVLQKKFSRSYMHADAHPGNILYDEKTGTLSMIDLQKSSLSIGQDGLTIGLPFLDLAQIKNSIFLTKIWGLTQNECEKLYNTFLNHYQSAGSLLPDSQTQEFFTLIDIFSFLKWFDEKKANFSTQDLKILETIVEEKWRLLKEMIK